MASVFVERIRARCASGEPADGQPVASDSSTAAKLLSACCRVVRVHGWRGAHAWCVRDERALHACARRVWTLLPRTSLTPPVGPGAQDAAMNVVGRALVSVKETDIEGAVGALSLDDCDVLMKYIYRGLVSQHKEQTL